MGILFLRYGRTRAVGINAPPSPSPPHCLSWAVWEAGVVCPEKETQEIPLKGGRRKSLQHHGRRELVEAAAQVSILTWLGKKSCSHPYMFFVLCVFCLLQSPFKPRTHTLPKWEEREMKISPRAKKGGTDTKKADENLTCNSNFFFTTSSSTTWCV